VAHRAKWQALGNSRCDRLFAGHTCREQRPHTIHWCAECGAKAVDENGDPLPETDQPALSGPITSRSDYADGMTDGLGGRGPDFARLALGANRLNAYERGYIDSGDAAPRPGQAVHDDCGHPDWPDCPHYGSP
jgi:hypothetical protein